MVKNKLQTRGVEFKFRKEGDNGLFITLVPKVF